MSETGADAFTALGPAVRQALSERGFTTPTEPQRKAIPPLAAGKHGLVVAPTGTGKTETAMLPVFDALAREDERFGIGALYVTPLRALNRDMRQRLDWWGQTLDLDVVAESNAGVDSDLPLTGVQSESGRVSGRLNAGGSRVHVFSDVGDVSLRTI